jgi:hypothetical protein
MNWCGWTIASLFVNERGEERQRRVLSWWKVASLFMHEERGEESLRRASVWGVYSSLESAALGLSGSKVFCLSSSVGSCCGG